jgi:chromosome segregation ATPase
VVTAVIGGSDRIENDLLRRFETVQAENFDDIRNRIYHKFLKRRFLTWSRSRDEVTDLVCNAHAAVTRQLRRELAELAKDRTKLYKKQLKKNEQALQDTRCTLVSRAEAAKREAQEMDATVSRVNADREKRLAELKAAETAAEKFPDRLQAKFEEVRSALMREAATVSGQLPGLAAAIAVLDRAQVYDSIKGG